eukprot:XP_027303941.1 ATP-dependent RNA helicase DDX25-like [Anas platyrhynchos]
MSGEPRACGTGDPRGTGACHEPAPSLVDVAESSLLNKLIHTSLVESSHHVEILQQDPNSPLFSVKSFEELHLKKELLQGVYAMGFNRPSKIQETALPMMLAHPPQNLIAQSQSGKGKTAAFVLAMLSRVNGAEKYLQMVWVYPFYLKGRWKKFSLEEGPVQLNSAKGLPKVLLRALFGMIFSSRALPRDCQMLLFSATFKETVWNFAMQIVSNPIIIKLRQEELTLSNIRQYYFMYRNRDEKYEALCNIYGSITIGQAMIFCQVKQLVCQERVVVSLQSVVCKRSYSVASVLLLRPSKGREG